MAEEPGRGALLGLGVRRAAARAEDALVESTEPATSSDGYQEGEERQIAEAY
jgi:hypothetical protein